MKNEIITNTIVRFNSDYHCGLSDEQVNQRFSEGLDNKSVDSPSKTTKEIITENVFTYFNLIFLVIAVLLILVHSYRDLTFLPVIISNTLIGIIQELRSKSVLDKLSVLNAPVTECVRNGKTVSVPSEKLVLDDVVVFGAGNQICADAVVIDGTVSVNESLLTGESDEITKKVGDTLMSGSFVVSGKCYAKLEKVGHSSYISQLTLQAKKSRRGEQSEMIRDLNLILKITGFILIPIGIIIFCQAYFFNHDTVKASVQGMVAAVLGMIPEGLYLVASAALVVSTVRLALKRVLVHDMKCIETLARVDVLCVDKTGTITENTMSVSDVVTLSDTVSSNEIHSLINDFSAAHNSDNETMSAIKKHFCSPVVHTAESVTVFSSEFKYSSAVFENICYVLGAPEFVLSDNYKYYSSDIEKFSRKGYRVLVFGIYDGIADCKRLSSPVTPLALIILSNPVRKNAVQTFRYFAEQGVEIKVISGDNPVTVSEVAKIAEIKNADKFIDASTLINEKSLYDAVKEYTVFGRVTPEQKRLLVKALKAQGKTVAMTGDGVNDVLALKDADCSVAMATGSDAAVHASQLVLLDSDFSAMPDVVSEGRRVVNNLERSGSLFIVKNLFSLLLALLTIILGIAYPLKPSQISLIGIFTIGIPGFFLSQMPDKSLIKGKFIRNIIIKALPVGITDTLIVLSMVFIGRIINLSIEETATACTILVGLTGLVFLYLISKPMDIYKILLWFMCMSGLAVSVLFIKNFFAISHMSQQCTLICLCLAVMIIPCILLLKRITEKIFHK